MDNVTLMPAAAFVEFEAQAKNHSRLAGEIVLLPLADRDGSIHQVLGGWFPAIAQDAMLEKPLIRHRITNIRILSDFDADVGPSEAIIGEARPNLRLIISNGKAL